MFRFSVYALYSYFFGAVDNSLPTYDDVVFKGSAASGSIMPPPMLTRQSDAVLYNLPSYDDEYYSESEEPPSYQVQILMD